MITWTCTTSRRLLLMKTMIKTFKENCLDLGMISRWIIVDDRSSAADIAKMKELYPDIEIYSNKRGGQAASLNKLFSLPDTEWIFHTEDDWEFLRKGHFIKQCMDIAGSDERIKNVTLRHWRCPYVIDGALEYRFHVYSPRRDNKLMLVNDSNWWGLSFNPGLLHVPTLKKLLPFETSLSIRDWDKKSACKYWNMGYRKANLVEKYIEHKGGGALSVYALYKGN